MSDVLEIIILGIVQGIAEFLPISSDGHLVLVNALLEHFTGRHRSDVLERTVALHAGTLLAVLIVYGRDLCLALIRERRVLLLLIVGTLPAVIFGLGADHFFKAWLEDPRLAGLGLIVTGCLLLWGARRRDNGQSYKTLGIVQSLRIGIFQAVAILPGVSRSGSTIVAGLDCGLARGDAATFSFLLSIPAVAGACTLEAIKMARGTTPLATPPVELALGALVSFVVGWCSLVALLKVLRAGRLQLFAYYCIPLGIAVVIWQLM